MELTIIMEEDAPHILPCFDEEDATITIKGAPLFISYNPAQVLTLASKHYLTGAVIFYRKIHPDFLRCQISPLRHPRIARFNDVR